MVHFRNFLDASALHRYNVIPMMTKPGREITQDVLKWMYMVISRWRNLAGWLHKNCYMHKTYELSKQISTSNMFSDLSSLFPTTKWISGGRKFSFLFIFFTWAKCRYMRWPSIEHLLQFKIHPTHNLIIYSILVTCNVM